MRTSILKLMVLADKTAVAESVCTQLKDKFSDKIRISQLTSVEDFGKLGIMPEALIIDYIIEGRSAQELVSRVKRRHPGLRVIMLSSVEDVCHSVGMLLKGESGDGVTAIKYHHKLKRQFC